MLAASVPVTNGKYNATTAGIYDAINFSDRIKNIKASNGAIVTVSKGDTVISGVDDGSGLGDYSIYAKGGSITIEGNLDAKGGYGDPTDLSVFFNNDKAVGYSIVVAEGIESNITLKGQSNTITSQSNVYRSKSGESILYSNNGKIEITGDETNLITLLRYTFSPGSRLITAQGATGLIKISNGKGVENSSLLIGISNSNARLIQANAGGSIVLDRVDLDGIANNNGRIMLAIGDSSYADENQSKIKFLGGDFNQGTAAASIGKTVQFGATALEANKFGKIEAVGYENGHLNIKVGGLDEVGILSVGGGIVDVNTFVINNNFIDNGFVTKINTDGARDRQHGIVSGSLATNTTNADNSKRYGAGYAGSRVNIYGTTDIDVKGANSYGLKVAGDDAQINMYALEGQSVRSTLKSDGTAVRFTAANGYAFDKNNVQGNIIGGQIVHLENIDISNNGMQKATDNHGIYTGHLIQVGSHGKDYTVDGQLTTIINVADAVKGAKLELFNSTSTASDANDRDLIYVTYGGGTPQNPTLVASDIAFNASHNTVLNGAMFTDYTLDSSSEASKLNLSLDSNSIWNITRDASDNNTWDGETVSGNFVTDLRIENSQIHFKHLDWTNDTELAEAQKNENFKNLYVANNYTSNNGLLEMNVVLGDDDSATDKLIVGGNTSGETYVNFNNIGGLGDQTNTGIKVVEVLGVSDGEFIKNNVVVAGLYEYSLVRGGSDGNMKDFYLTSKLQDKNVYRPEVGSYLGNMTLANMMFDLRLYDRETHLQHLNNEDEAPNLWMINSYSRFNQSFSDHDLRGKGNLYNIRIGTDLRNDFNEKGEQNLIGIMASYGNGSQTTNNKLIGRSSKGSVNGFTIGVYSSWFENVKDRSGWYVDSWAQYGWFDNEINGAGLEKESYDSEGWALSAEVGKTINYKKTDNKTYYWQPKAQVSYSKIKSGTHTESNGTEIAFGNSDAFHTRVGLRWLSEQNQAFERKDSCFAEVNWLYNSKDYVIYSLGDSVSTKGNKHLGELRVGYEKEISKDLLLGLNASGRFGSHNYRSYQGMVTVEYSF